MNILAKNPQPIDVVYLWVDPTDSEWRAQKNKWHKIINTQTTIRDDAAGDERFRDNGELLYSFRSLAQYAPWVNHIYLVTGFGHVPKWLNTKHPKVTIIPHEQIMPANALPTFNSNAIEMCITNIPGLSEHFLIMNDDVFFNRHVTPSFFYDSQNRARVRYSKNAYDPTIPFDEWKSSMDQYTQTLALSAKYIDDIFGIKMYNMRPSHGIDPYIKSTWDECKNHNMLKRQISNQICNKFRTPDETQRWLINMYDYATGRAVFYHARAPKSGHHRIINAIYNLIHYMKIRNANIVCTNAARAKHAIKHAATFCINDSPKNDANTFRDNAQFLQKRFPNKCEYEK